MPEKNSTPQSKTKSSEKRNLGYVQLRRGLKEHLHRSRMSSNASTLFFWLLLSAYHSGPKRGCVEANYEDVMRNLGWTYSMVRRTMGELAQKGYIVATPAANQHEITKIRIPKFDTREDDSALSTGEHSKTSDEPAMSGGVLSALSTGEHSSEQSRPPISRKAQELQTPKNAVEGIEEKNGKADAVRRPEDAEHRIAIRKSFSPSERRKNIEERLAVEVRKNGNTFDDELDDEGWRVFKYVGYEPPDPRSLPSGFVCAAWDVYDTHKGKLPSPGNLCSKIIDRCVSEQKSWRTLNGDPSEFYWPPDFKEHRDRLRAQERAREQAVPVGRGVQG
jgi:hypothetical protein